MKMLTCIGGKCDGFQACVEEPQKGKLVRVRATVSKPYERGVQLQIDRHESETYVVDEMWCSDFDGDGPRPMGSGHVIIRYLRPLNMSPAECMETLLACYSQANI